MDVALMISDVAAAKYKEECKTKECQVFIKMHYRYEHTIEIVPLTNHIILRYKSIEYKVSKQNKEEFDEVVSFLVEEISDAINYQLENDIVYEGYRPDTLSKYLYEQNYVCVQKKEETIFYKRFDSDAMQEVVGKYLKGLRLLN